MTTSNDKAKTTNKSFTGERKEGFAATTVAGIVGGVLGAAAHFNGTKNIGSSLIAGAAGVTVGWAAGRLVAPVQHLGTPATILGSAWSGLLGASIAITAGELAGSVMGVAQEALPSAGE
ncbi:TPA: hypothetical protein ACWLXL_004457 [Pseudomonas aeruginosa]|nr:hypothetical protein [Pseudomonas aeruginosa]